MKTIKFFLALLMVMLGATAFAQGVVVHKTDGTTEVIHDVDSVVYETSAIGYYSFKATTKAEIASLTEDDFTKLEGTPIEIPCNIEGFPCILTKSSIAPIMTWSIGSGWLDPIVMKKTEGTSIGISTIAIKGEEYIAWYLGYKSYKGEKVKIEIK